MELKNYQILLAKLYTDAKFRDLFWKNPALIGKEFGLDENTANLLAQENKKEIENYSQILINKRLTAFKNICPLTTQWLGQKLHSIFNEFSDNHLKDEPDRYIQDAFYFGKFLQKKDFFIKENTEIKQKLCLEWLNLRTEKPFLRIKLSKNFLYVHFHFLNVYRKIIIHFPF
jgi:hypothetical protein